MTVPRQPVATPAEWRRYVDAGVLPLAGEVELPEAEEPTPPEGWVPPADDVVA